MAKVQDFRSDFRKGRTGTALRIRQDVKSYTSSLKEAKNMMVLAMGVLRGVGEQKLKKL